MAKRARKTNSDESNTQTAPETGEVYTEGKELPAVIRDHSFNAVVADGKICCPHCMRQVPKNALIDPERKERLKQREEQLAERQKKNFARMVKMLNQARKQQGKPELTEEEVTAAASSMNALFG